MKRESTKPTNFLNERDNDYYDNDYCLQNKEYKIR